MQTGPVGKMARVVHTRLSISWGAMSIALTDLHGHVSPDAPVLELWGIHVWEPDPPLRSEGQRPLPKQKHGRRMADAWASRHRRRSGWNRWNGFCSARCRPPAQRRPGGEPSGMAIAGAWKTFTRGSRRATPGSPPAPRPGQAATLPGSGLNHRRAPAPVTRTDLGDSRGAGARLGGARRSPGDCLAGVPAPRSIEHRTLCAGVAQMGGFLGRRSDGDPGWQTLWKGWERLQWKVEGLRLARQQSPP